MIVCPRCEENLESPDDAEGCRDPDCPAPEIHTVLCDGCSKPYRPDDLYLLEDIGEALCGPCYRETVQQRRDDDAHNNSLRYPGM